MEHHEPSRSLVHGIIYSWDIVYEIECTRRLRQLSDSSSGGRNTGILGRVVTLHKRAASGLASRGFCGAVGNISLGSMLMARRGHHNEV
jgi:hypothetical protein